MRVVAAAVFALAFAALVVPASVIGQGQGRGGRGGPAGPPQTPRAGAPVDLTGNWVSVVTEDWQWRMRTPAKGDLTTINGVLNAEGRRVANEWDPSMDGRCEAYGVGGIMRMPTRLRISWENDTTLKIETDAGMQTRLLRFAPAPPPGERTLQGHSVAEWIRGGRGFDAFLERGTGAGGQQGQWGELRVVTTNMRPGWLRRNGVPYSENTTIVENVIRIAPPGAGDWIVVSTQVTDPKYLSQMFVTSSNFKKEADGSKWNPTPCKNS